MCGGRAGDPATGFFRGNAGNPIGEQPQSGATPGLERDRARHHFHIIRDLRRVITGALELARADKTIGSSLEAAPALVVTDAADKALFDSIDLAEIAITSTAKVETSSSLDGLYTVP